MDTSERINAKNGLRIFLKQSESRSPPIHLFPVSCGSPPRVGRTQEPLISSNETDHHPPPTHFLETSTVVERASYVIRIDVSMTPGARDNPHPLASLAAAALPTRLTHLADVE